LKTNEEIPECIYFEQQANHNCSQKRLWANKHEYIH
ncbi:hypothetical protein T11_17172, partial [Trichinella zimbabwensis]